MNGAAMIRELKTFVAVTQFGTFAAAGQHIGLTQSAVSAQIRSLEDALGMPLFDRSGRTAQLNTAGNRALPMAEEILAIFARMSQPEDLDRYRGAIKIGAIATVQTGLLPKMLVQLHRQAPALEMKLLPGVSFDLLTQVDAGHIDLAIALKPSFALSKDLYYETLKQEPFVLITPPDLAGDNPLAIIREKPFIRYDRTSFGGRLVTRFLREQRLEPNQVLEIDEIDAIVKMVENNLGVALVPQAGLWHERENHVRIVPLGDLTFCRQLIVATRQADQHKPLHQMIIQCLHHYAKQ